MKQIFLTCSILTIAMILIPLAVLKDTRETPVLSSSLVEDDSGYISVMKSENGKVEKVNEREYLIGSLAAEMDLSCHDEALKAQAVACYTYALYTKNKNLDDELNGADISDDTDVHQGYLNIDERKEKWGEKFEENEKKAGEIVDTVSGKLILYQNEPILAVYHDLNVGKTMSAELVWKEEIPYLTQKESPGDKLSPKYSQKVDFSRDDFKKSLEKIDGIVLDDSDGKWTGKTEKTDDGYVKSIEVCGEKMSAEDFCTALELKSKCFTVAESEDKISINVIGNGHMVGMSQYGADYMARQGSDYEEILKYYYSNVEIQ